MEFQGWGLARMKAQPPNLDFGFLSTIPWSQNSFFTIQGAAEITYLKLGSEGMPPGNGRGAVGTGGRKD